LREAERRLAESKDTLRQALKDISMMNVDRAHGDGEFRANVAHLKHQVSPQISSQKKT